MKELPAIPVIYCKFSELQPLQKLVENPNNPNTHPKKQLDFLVKIILVNGWRSPIVVSKRSGFIVKGHGRYQAAKLAGWLEVPVDIQDYANEAEEWADMIADNKIAELSINDNLKLKSLMTDLNGKIDVGSLGMTEEEFGNILKENKEAVTERLKKETSIACPNCNHVIKQEFFQRIDKTV